MKKNSPKNCSEKERKYNGGGGGNANAEERKEKIRKLYGRVTELCTGVLKKHLTMCVVEVAKVRVGQKKKDKSRE